MSIILFKLLILFSFLLGIGTLITIALFKFKLSNFIKSELSKKILFWIPIFIGFIIFIFSNNPIRILILFLLSLVISIEYLNKIKKLKHNRLFFCICLLLFLFSLSHLLLIQFSRQDFLLIFLTIGLASALSDITAFFFGKLVGKHTLPPYINPQKSWEGILGQILGGLLGVCLVNLYITSEANIIWFIPIGIGSALGDIFNSFIKRQLLIKNWSNLIPGHGGFSDRFSSIAGSSLLTFYFLLIF